MRAVLATLARRRAALVERSALQRVQIVTAVGGAPCSSSMCSSTTVTAARYAACCAMVSHESMRPTVTMSKTKPVEKKATATSRSLRPT